MSIRRIESAYAHCMGDKRVSGTDMAVLIALAYVANGEKGEACYPSASYLESLTHFKAGAIGGACARLKKYKLIDWISGGNKKPGGNVANVYKFLFPLEKIKSRRERYESLATQDATPVPIPPKETPTPPDAVPTSANGIPTPRDEEPTPPREVPYPTSCGTLPHEVGTNTERILKVTSESKPEGKDTGILSLFDVKFQTKEDTKKQRETPIVVQLAMKACGVSDDYNRNTFIRIMRNKDENRIADEILAFESEIKCGEHDNANNLAAVLTKRLLAKFPD